MRERTGGRVRVLFTAHSLPQRIIDAGDPYPDELRSTAEAVAARVGLTEGDDWQIAWQSAGRTPEPWIGPDILEVIDSLADEDVAGVIVSACGFVADHLEVLYDLDIEASDRASSHGLAFDRTACVNDDRHDHGRPRRSSARRRSMMSRQLPVTSGPCRRSLPCRCRHQRTRDRASPWPTPRPSTSRSSRRQTGSAARSTPRRSPASTGVDEGADAFLARVPEAVALAHRVGLGDDLVSPEPVGAAVWHDGLHPIPDGLMLGLPGKLLPLATTGLLSWRGKARAALEPFLPRTSTDSDSIGDVRPGPLR